MKSRLEEVIANPQAEYVDPREVAKDDALSQEEKIQVLQSWKAEAVHIQESTAEGFDGGERSHLEEVVQALHEVSQ